MELIRAALACGSNISSPSLLDVVKSGYEMCEISHSNLQASRTSIDHDHQWDILTNTAGNDTSGTSCGGYSADSGIRYSITTSVLIISASAT